MLLAQTNDPVSTQPYIQCAVCTADYLKTHPTAVQSLIPEDSKEIDPSWMILPLHMKQVNSLLMSGSFSTDSSAISTASESK